MTLQKIERNQEESCGAPLESLSKLPKVNLFKQLYASINTMEMFYHQSAQKSGSFYIRHENQPKIVAETAQKLIHF